MASRNLCGEALRNHKSKDKSEYNDCPGGNSGEGEQAKSTDGKAEIGNGIFQRLKKRDGGGSYQPGIGGNDSFE